MAKLPGTSTPKEGKASAAKPELLATSNPFIPRSVLLQHKKKDHSISLAAEPSKEPSKSPSAASEYSDIFQPSERLATLTLTEEADHVTDMNRQRTGRSTAVRGDGNKDTGDVDFEAHKSLVREGLLEAKKHNDRSRELGLQIIALEEEIKSKGSSKFIFHSCYQYSENLRWPLLLLLCHQYVLANCTPILLQYAVP